MERSPSHPPRTERTERAQTDASLRSERTNVDDALREHLADVEARADDLVDQAREEADEVLERARDRADADGEGAEHSVARERAEADRVVHVERATADDALRREREEQRRVLASLLPLERAQTDRRLLTERVVSDDAVAHRDDFMGMVTHDLRNLFSGVVMDADALVAEAVRDDVGDRAVVRAKRIRRYVARMNRLIGDLVDVVSIDAGKLAISGTEHDVAALVEEAVTAFAAVASDAGLALEQTCEVRGAARFDHDRMLQVLANLIGNALKFTPRGGRVRVSAFVEDGALCFDVSDTGPGIDPAMIDSIFERFWQAGKDDRRGLGLGLHITRQIVEAHGGSIRVVSAPGQGAVFHVVLPGAVGPRAH